MPVHGITDELIFKLAALKWFSELAPQGVFTTDADLNIRSWNGWLESRSRRNERDLIGRNLLEVFPDLVDRRLDVHYREAVQGRVKILSSRFHDFLLEMPAARGGSDTSSMKQSVRIAPLFYEQQVIGTITTIEDVTERISRETKLIEQVATIGKLLASERAAHKQADQANRLKDEFLGMVSHELRTPLAAILGWSHLLLAGNLDKEARARALQSVQRNAKSQLQLVNDLLDVTRIVSGKLTLTIGPVDLRSVIEAAMESVEFAAQVKDIHIELLVGEETGLVMGDQDRLQQVVWNLLANATKFTPDGGRIEVQLHRINSEIEIVVTDTGEGIASEALPYVFERFRQADSSTTRAYGGLGLGLSIVRHLVELHGGTVRAQSAGPGQGATFTVKLPLGSKGAALPDDIRFDADLADLLTQLEGVYILVVDDEEDSRLLLTRMLEHCRATVISAGSAGEGINLLRQLRPDILIADVGMPGKDGYALISEVRELPADQGGMTPALALTGYAREEDRSRALLSGFQMHIGKPVEPSELVRAIARLAGKTDKRALLG